MLRSSIQRLISLICLVAFGLAQTLFASMGVRCTDASGETRIEFACIKSRAGACLSSCMEPNTLCDEDNHENDPTTPTPCEDEQLGSQINAAQSLRANVQLDHVFAAVVVAILWNHWSFADEQLEQMRQLKQDRDRPPDSLTCLRSVILIV